MRPLRQIHFGKRFSKPGTAPGTLTAPEVRRVESVSITVMDYDTESLEERSVATVEEALAACRPSGVTWIDVVGLHDVEVVRQLGEHFRLHPLALEDVLSVGQRPKADEYENHYFIVMRLFHVIADGLESEQLSLFLGDNYVITFQELPEDVFDGVRDRLRNARGRIRSMGADYLAYALIDSQVDHFFPVIEKLGERIEDLEDEVMTDPQRDTVEQIHAIRKDLLLLRRAAWPQREVLAAMERFESARIGKETRVFLRDAYDHAVQIMDMVETYRDLASGLLEIYLSSVSNRMNEVMKVLTVMATIFIPITFLAGVYGMNFKHMPELYWTWGYPAFWGVTVVTTLGLLWYFKRKDWL